MRSFIGLRLTRGRSDLGEKAMGNGKGIGVMAHGKGIGLMAHGKGMESIWLRDKDKERRASGS